MHDQEEYGVLRWPLKEIAQAVGCSVASLKALSLKGVLKGDDKHLAEAYVYTPRSGRKVGDPVVLLDTQDGPIWYSSRMVKDEYVRTIRGESSRFGEGDDNPKGKKKTAPKDAPKPPLGDGSSSSSSTSLKDTPLPPDDGGAGWARPDWIPADLWAGFEEVRKKRKKPMTDKARQMAVNKLAALRAGGNDPKAVMEQTILHAWDTFYPLKTDASNVPSDDFLQGAI
ncbi:hypothetical protein RE432_14920 [Pusillimonas sp. SM2304]|uniref:hypothetical protein n=1 Tax=Pusillimonas sp. SM2304 TaxID=3073241 RepID=UPI0028742408|nr:hypothetical protein [Pusillimonas sp. SM2304]MDS1141731.1 hypothetical protein [Pusillimonas sp. SM2304]